MVLLDDLILLNEIQESVKILEKSELNKKVITMIKKLRILHLKKILENDMMKDVELMLLIPEESEKEKKEKMINQTRSYYAVN